MHVHESMMQMKSTEIYKKIMEKFLFIENAIQYNNLRQDAQ